MSDIEDIEMMLGNLADRLVVITDSEPDDYNIDILLSDVDKLNEDVDLNDEDIDKILFDLSDEEDSLTFERHRTTPPLQPHKNRNAYDKGDRGHSPTDELV